MGLRRLRYRSPGQRSPRLPKSLSSVQHGKGVLRANSHPTPASDTEARNKEMADRVLLEDARASPSPSLDVLMCGLLVRLCSNG